MKDKEKKVTFPIKCHEKCPECGSEEGIGTGTIRQLKEDGKLSKDIFPKGLMVQTPLLDIIQLQKALAPVPQMPVFTWYYEICAKCYYLYIKEVDLTWQPVPFQTQPIRRQSPPMKGG